MSKAHSGKAIILLGLKHSGKSSIAKMLAPAIGREAVDTDELVAKMFAADFAAEMNPLFTGYQEINRHFYKLKGQAVFWEMEARALGSIANWERLVVATGGGIMENREAMHIARQNGIVIFMQAPENLLFDRIARNGIPPFLDKNRPEESFHELYLKRTGLARSYADIEIDNGHLPIETVCSLVQESIQEYLYGR